MTIAITGSTSNLGLYLVKYFKTKRKKVIEINRKQNNFDLRNIKTYDFKNDKVKVLIHLAHSYSKNGYNINFQGSKKLFLNARKNNINKIIFISSISAHKKALSQYGKTKFRIENFCLKNDIIIIRPGLIFGYKIDKKLKMMKNILKYLPIIPYFRNSKKFLYSVHMDELVKNIYKIIISKKKIGNYNIFSDKKIYFEDLINTVSVNKIKLNFPYIFWYFIFISISKIIYFKSVDSFLGILGNRVNYNNNKEKNIFTKTNLLKKKF